MSGQARRIIPKVSGLVKPDHVPASVIENMPVLSGGNDSEGNSTAAREPERTAQAPGHTPGVTLLPLDKIVDSPYQNRKIDEAHASDLAENILSDGLNQPITVRQIEDGRFEVIAGHHRRYAYKLLARDRIPAVVKHTDELGAARSLLFDNIHHKNYTDYQIYNGFKTLRQMDKNTSIRSLARDTGWSKTQVLRVLAFEKLPDEALKILDENQDLIGANAAYDLAEFCENGHEQHVIEAIEHIKDGHLTQARATSWIKNRIAPKGRAISREILRNGKTYCSVKLERNILKINVAKNIDPQEVEDAICAFLADKAAEQAETDQ